MKITNPKLGLWIVLFIVSLSMTFCTAKKKTPMSKIDKTDAITTIVTAPIVSKTFVSKSGKSTSQKDLYLQASIQDYYIKFCESKITRKELENHLAAKDDFFKTATLEIEYRDGLWDSCNEENDQQSRSGKYVIIHRIINN